MFRVEVVSLIFRLSHFSDSWAMAMGQLAANNLEGDCFTINVSRFSVLRLRVAYWDDELTNWFTLPLLKDGFVREC